MVPFSRCRRSILGRAVVAAILLSEAVHCVLPKFKRAGVSPRAVRPAVSTATPAAPANAKPSNTAAATGKNNILPLSAPQNKIDAATLTALVASDPGDELDEPLRLVSGAIPKDLRGTLYVNGPARVIDGRGRAAHPLDGHGFVRAFSFGDGVKVRGRFVRTWAFEVENFFDRNLFRGFFSLPFAPSTPLRLFNALSLWRKNVANTAVVAWAGRLLCLWEQGPPHALDVETLETAAGWDHLNYLETPACAVSRLRPLLAHTKVWVADDGRERLVGLSVVGSAYNFYEFDETGECAKTVAVELPFSNPLTHDFSLTEHYYIVAENPVRYEPDVAGALDGSQPALGPSFVASEDRPGLLALVPRDGTEPIVLEGDASIVFHYANAWEEGSRVKIAACAFARYELGAEYGFDAAGGRFDPSLLLRHDNAWGPFLRLSTVDLAAGTVSHETVEHVHREFPRVHPRREGRPTKYAYVAASPHIQEGEPFFPFQCIQKVALDGSGRTLTWKPSKPGCFVGEPVVAPRPGAVEEDDAWLLVVVHDVHAAATDLVVLDARTLAAAAELRVDRLLPLGLHGTWA